MGSLVAALAGGLVAAGLVVVLWAVTGFGRR